jgi:ketosteroid isomerase-like protein
MTSIQEDSTREQLIAVAHRHAAAEAAGDIEGTMATLGSDSVYELFPVGLQLRGRDAARRYYEYFFSTVLAQTVGYTLVSEWVNEVGVLQEYDVTFRIANGATKVFRVLGILKFGDELLSGERLYADEECLKILFGPVWRELEPL